MSSSRYLRAHTSLKARCPTCGEQLIRLRWGHEERCEAFTEARRRRLVRVGLALVIFGVFISPFFTLP